MVKLKTALNENKTINHNPNHNINRFEFLQKHVFVGFFLNVSDIHVVLNFVQFQNIAKVDVEHQSINKLSISKLYCTCV